MQRGLGHTFYSPLWGAGGCSPGNAELQVSTGHVTNDTSGCLIRGISLVRLTSGFVAEDICCCECTQAAITHRSVNRFCHTFLKCFCHWPPKNLGAICSTGQIHWENLWSRQVHLLCVGWKRGKEEPRCHHYLLYSTRDLQHLVIHLLFAYPICIPRSYRRNQMQVTLKSQSSQTFFKAIAFNPFSPPIICLFHHITPTNNLVQSNLPSNSSLARCNTPL